MGSLMHCVYFWLVDGLTEDEKSAFTEEGLKTLPAIDVVASGNFGIAAATPDRPVTDHSFDFWLTLTFDSLEDQETYQVHPAHEAFVKRFSPWFKEVRVYDGTLGILNSKKPSSP